MTDSHSTMLKTLGLAALLASCATLALAQAKTIEPGQDSGGLILLPNSRTQESEADVVGQRLMAQAGFDPRQAVNLWENMMAAGGGRPPQWLSTHPDPTNRIRELQRDAPALVPTYEAARKAGNTPRCG